MNAIVMPPPNSLKSASRQRWDRMEGETHRAYFAHIAYRDIGSDRTIQKAADLLQKNGSVLRRWSLRFDWKNRAADFDAYIEAELQRRLLARRAHARERALATAEMLDEKVCEAVRMLKVAKVVKVEGRPDEVTLLITPGELARLFEVSYRVQTAILGDGKEDRAAAIYVNIGTADPKYAFEQPAAMQEARRKARQANQLM